MGKESFKKETEILRTLFIDDGIYDRETIANMLGISKDTYDKTRLKLAGQLIEEERFQQIYGRAQLKYSYHKNNENLLMALFHTKSLRKTERKGLLFVLKLFSTGKTMEISDITKMSRKYTLDSRNDWVTIKHTQAKRYVETLLEAGFLLQVTKKRPYRFTLNDTLLQDLTVDELMDLFYYVDFMANTGVPSAPGYMLKNTLKSYIEANHPSSNPSLSVYEYQYNQFGRVLDEALALDLMEIIEEKQSITLKYYPVRTGKRYATEGNGDALQISVIPLQIIFDEYLSRWYLVAKKKEDTYFRKFRLDYVVDFTPGERVDEEIFETLKKEFEVAFKHSWLIGTGQKELVRIKFFFHPTEDNVNFIKNRVLQQGRFGKITEERDQYFIFEIEVNDVREMKPWIRSFGSSAEVISPQTLREEIIRDFKEVNASYESISETTES